MEQRAHQAVVMQFMMEMAINCNVDPRRCFHLFFQKAKTAEGGYFEVFKNELDIFKSGVRLYSQSQSFQPVTVQDCSPSCHWISRFVRIQIPSVQLSAVLTQWDIKKMMNPK